jgi:hypothetical protein
MFANKLAAACVPNGSMIRSLLGARFMSNRRNGRKGTQPGPLSDSLMLRHENAMSSSWFTEEAERPTNAHFLTLDTPTLKLLDSELRPCSLVRMENYPIELVDGTFRITGFPDAVKLISFSSLAPSQARELSDIASCRLDLIFAKSCLVFLETADLDQPQLPREALWRAAIIYYCKCFDQTGPRGPLSSTEILPDIPDSDIQPQKVHEYFRNLRNKHLIHDENDWLQVLVGAVIGPAGQSSNVERVVCSTFMGQTLVEANFSNLRRLIENALAWIDSRADDLCEEIAAGLEEVPRETLLSQPDLNYRAPELEAIRSRRPRI